MEQSRKKLGLNISAVLILAVLLFVVVNFVSQRFFSYSYFDLTGNKIYTLSEGSKQIVSQLKEPITLRYYFSKKLAKDSSSVTSYAARVEELLVQYQKLSKGKVKLEIIDPEPFTEAEDRAVNYGLQGIPLGGDGNELYFGLVGTDSTTGKELIPFFQPNREAYLEYDVTQVIHNLSNPTQKTIGVISTLAIEGRRQGYGQEPQAWMILEQMKQNFDVQMLDKEIGEIPEEIKVLMLVNPRELNDKTLYAIDQYVLKGGHLIAFADPYSEAMGGVHFQFGEKTKRDFSDLLKAWGVEFNPKQVVASRYGSKQVRYRKGDKEQVSHFPLWFDVENTELAQDDIVTSQLERLSFATPGIITPIEGAQSQFTPLIQTTEDTMLIPLSELNQYKEDPLFLMRKFKTDNTPYTIGARITGKIATAFPEGFAEGLASGKTHLTSHDKANIVMVADADMLQDDFWVSVQRFFGNAIALPNSGNGSFVISALEHLTGSEALISVRNRGTFQRPFKKIEELQIQSQERFQAKELALLDQMEKTKQKLDELEKQKQEGNAILLGEQQKAEEMLFRNELVATRKELREVRRELRRDIEDLQSVIKFINIGLMPIIISVFGILYFALRRRGRKRSLENALGV